VGTVGAVLAGMILTATTKLFKNFTMTAGIGLMSVGMFAFYFSNSVVLCILASVLIGLGFGTYVPSGFAKAPCTVAPSAATLSIALFASANSMGQFLNPYIVTNIAASINATVSARYLVSALGLLILFAVNIAMEVKNGKNETCIPAEQNI